MRVNQKLAVLAALVLAGASCHKKTQPIVPFPKATPTPVVVPNNPTPAPTPFGDGSTVPPKSEYETIRQMDIVEIDRAGLLGDIYFDYDQADLRETDRATLVRNGETLKKFDFLIVTIEGHADERGTIEYNLALSDRRARGVYDYLASVGIAPSRSTS